MWLSCSSLGLPGQDQCAIALEVTPQSALAGRILGHSAVPSFRWLGLMRIRNTGSDHLKTLLVLSQIHACGPPWVLFKDKWELILPSGRSLLVTGTRGSIHSGSVYQASSKGQAPFRCLGFMTRFAGISNLHPILLLTRM